MHAVPTTTDAYRLLHEGSMVMAEMERNGIRVDLRYTKSIGEKITKRIAVLNERQKNDKVYKKWRKVYKGDTNLGSRDQLADILYNHMGYVPDEERATKTRYAADKDALVDINIPFTRRYIEIEKLKKAKGTYIRNILREEVDGFVHPNFNLHLVQTFRGSSDAPNFTNIPIRDELIKKLIRRCFIARKKHRIVDLDFKGSEVNAAAWYHKDPTMLNYIKTDPGRLHFDMAMECYKLPAKLMTSDIRFAAKGGFVFSQFYGDWWKSCAKGLWKACKQQKLKTADGTPLLKHLKRHGIRELGTGNPDLEPRSFEAHIKNVEHNFWYKKFPKYQEWKEEWYESYLENGFLRMLTGFVCEGFMDRKKVVNYPIQGTAFHCLLWCLIRISQLVRKYNLSTKLIGQIHDDAVADVPTSEFENYLEICTDVITRQLKKHWRFIITPMRVEVEATPIGGSWYEKKEVENGKKQKG